MPNKTLYVKEDDVHIWDTAALAAGEGNLSSYVTEALRQRIVKPEPSEEFKRIVVGLMHGDDFGDFEKKKAFVGRWLIEPDNDEAGIALTQKGQFVFYSFVDTEFEVFPNLSDLRDKVDRDLYEAAEARLHPVEELDI